MTVSDAIVEAWFFSLEDIPNEIGIRAAKALMKTKVVGDYEPWNLIQAVEDLGPNSEENIDFMAYPRISEAKPYDGPERGYPAWLEAEREKYYRAVNSDGDVFLVRNPNCWHGVEHLTDGKRVQLRAEPPKLVGKIKLIKGQNGFLR
jgi:hypothetical protein